jgi:hypothetical protein
MENKSSATYHIVIKRTSVTHSSIWVRSLVGSEVAIRRSSIWLSAGLVDLLQHKFITDCKARHMVRAVCRQDISNYVTLSIVGSIVVVRIGINSEIDSYVHLGLLYGFKLER